MALAGRGCLTVCERVDISFQNARSLNPVSGGHLFPGLHKKWPPFPPWVQNIDPASTGAVKAVAGHVFLDNQISTSILQPITAHSAQNRPPIHHPFITLSETPSSSGTSRQSPRHCIADERWMAGVALQHVPDVLQIQLLSAQRLHNWDPKSTVYDLARLVLSDDLPGSRVRPRRSN